MTFQNVLQDATQVFHWNNSQATFRCILFGVWSHHDTVAVHLFLHRVSEREICILTTCLMVQLLKKIKSWFISVVANTVLLI